MYICNNQINITYNVDLNNNKNRNYQYKWIWVKIDIFLIQVEKGRWASEAQVGPLCEDKILAVWGLNSSLWKPKIFILHSLYHMAADSLVTQGARASAAMVLTHFSWNILASVPEGLTDVQTDHQSSRFRCHKTQIYMALIELDILVFWQWNCCSCLVDMIYFYGLLNWNIKILVNMKNHPLDLAHCSLGNVGVILDCDFLSGIILHNWLHLNATRPYSWL